MNMKLFFFSLFACLISVQGWTQLAAGFNVEEVKTTSALCTSYHSDEKAYLEKHILPKEFELIFSSEVIGMDNKFEVYTDNKIGIINYRGSTSKAISWIENCYSAMIPAKDTFLIEGKAHPYNFSNKENAAVHTGFALSIVLLSDKIFEQINNLNDRGIHEILITGHSQGGALATLTRAYLENTPNKRNSTQNSYKTYAYAAPMSGNKEFSDDYNLNYSTNNTAFLITNPTDFVPLLPHHFDEEKVISVKRITNWLTKKEKFSLKKIGNDIFFKTFESTVTKYVNGTNTLLNKLVDIKFGHVEVPPFVADVNFYPCGNKKELEPFDYPKIKVDPDNLGDLKIEDTYIEDGNYYKKGTSFFQHKPYNYHVYCLKKWDEKSYKKLRKKYLKSDL